VNTRCRYFFVPILCVFTIVSTAQQRPKPATTRYACWYADLSIAKGQYVTSTQFGNTVIIRGLKYQHNHQNGDPGVCAVWLVATGKLKRWTQRSIVFYPFFGDSVTITSSKGWSRVRKENKWLYLRCNIKGSVITYTCRGRSRRITVGELHTSLPRDSFGIST
jgi:hypothetical protein